MSTLLDTQGIADMLGLSRQHVTNRVTKMPGFPKPVINMSQRTRMWSRADVIKFAQGKDRRMPRSGH